MMLDPYTIILDRKRRRYFFTKIGKLPPYTPTFGTPSLAEEKFFVNFLDRKKKRDNTIK